VLLVMGLVGLGLGIAYAFWLLLAHRHVIFEVLLPAGIGDTKAISELKELNLASPVAIYATIVTFFLELVLTGILLWTSTGLISMRPSARWAAVFYGIFMILVGTFNVILAVFVLATPAQPVNVLAVLARGVIVLFAIVLWGTMFLPVVTAAYGGQEAPEEIDEGPFEQDDEEPEPPPSRRRQKERMDS
jgi:hypothetical protein